MNSKEEAQAAMAAEMLAHLAKLEVDTQALADVRTLDEWALAGGVVEQFTGIECHVALQGDRVPLRWKRFHGPTPDAARHAAAEWVRGQR